MHRSKWKVVLSIFGFQSHLPAPERRVVIIHSTSAGVDPRTRATGAKSMRGKEILPSDGLLYGRSEALGD